MSANMSPITETSSDQSTTLEAPPAPSPPQSVARLPNEAIDLANRMFDLARNGDPQLLTYLSSGLPSNLTNNRGDSLLMLASYHGHTDLVRRMLVESQQSPSTQGRGWRGRPDPNQLNGRGQSIVAGAVFKGCDEVVRVLVEHGADPLAGQPSAEECARMFNTWDGEKGYKELFEGAKGRGVGGREAAPAVEDREEVRRVPGVGLQRTTSEAGGQQSSTDASRPPFQAER